MAKKSSGLAWAVGLATVAVAGIGIAIYEKTKGAPATGTPGSTDTATATAPVGQAAIDAVAHGGDPNSGTVAGQATAKAIQLYNLSKTSANPQAELNPAKTWASQARSAGASQLQLNALSAAGL